MEDETRETENCLSDRLYFNPENRAVLLYEDITDKVGAEISDQLLGIDAQQEEPSLIELHINSNGGLIYPGIQIMETIKGLRSPVVGIVTGWVASAAFYILQACDIRCITPLSFLLWHEIMKWDLSIYSKTEAEKQFKHYSLVQSSLEDFLVERAKMNKTNFKKYFSGNEIYFSASQALELNLVDEILYSKKTQSKKTTKVR